MSKTMSKAMSKNDRRETMGMNEKDYLAAWRTQIAAAPTPPWERNFNPGYVERGGRTGEFRTARQDAATLPPRCKCCQQRFDKATRDRSAYCSQSCEDRANYRDVVRSHCATCGHELTRQATLRGIRHCLKPGCRTERNRRLKWGAGV